MRRFSGATSERLRLNRMGDIEAQSVTSSLGQTLAERRYSYDAMGALTGLEDLRSGQVDYQYDATPRLVRSLLDGEERERFRYDMNGNLAERSGVGAFEYARGDRIVAAGPNRYAHDANGNVAEVRRGGEGTHLESDALGRLRRARLPDGRVVEYGYDGIGRRVFKRVEGQETRFYWHDFALLGEQTESDPFIEYLIVPGTFDPYMMWRGEKPYHFVSDRLGTAHEVLDSEGRVAWSGRLDDHGRLTRVDVARVPNPLRFAGQYHDVETGFYYNTWRYYDPHTGRYLSPDPAGLAAGLNLYGYCINPVMETDPLGLRSPSSPNTDITRQHRAGEFGTSCAACGVNAHGPGRQRPSSPDHIVPYTDIERMPGYENLTQENRARIQNDPDNFVTLCRPCNQSRGNKPYTDWPGHPDNPLLPGAKARLARRQAALRTTLQRRINDLLADQEEQATNARSQGCG
jgi:RHS repeat-associated protein